MVSTEPPCWGFEFRQTMVHNISQAVKPGEKSMATWLAWFGKLGKAVVDAGAPTMPGKIVSAGGVKSIGTKPVTGYSILQAENIDAAIAMAKSAPALADGGQVAVYTLMPM